MVATSRPSFAADAYVGQLWRVPLTGHAAPRRLTRGRSDSSPRFSPDGRLIGFLRPDADGTPQLHVVEASGGEPLVLTDQKLGVGEFVFSPDSRSVAFIARVADDGRYGTLEGVGRQAGGSPPLLRRADPHERCRIHHRQAQTGLPRAPARSRRRSRPSSPWAGWPSNSPTRRRVPTPRAPTTRAAPRPAHRRRLRRLRPHLQPRRPAPAVHLGPPRHPRPRSHQRHLRSAAERRRAGVDHAGRTVGVRPPRGHRRDALLARRRPRRQPTWFRRCADRRTRARRREGHPAHRRRHLGARPPSRRGGHGARHRRRARYGCRASGVRRRPGRRDPRPGVGARGRRDSGHARRRGDPRRRDGGR